MGEWRVQNAADEHVPGRWNVPITLCCTGNLEPSQIRASALWRRHLALKRKTTSPISTRSPSRKTTEPWSGSSGFPLTLAGFVAVLILVAGGAMAWLVGRFDVSAEKQAAIRAELDARRAAAE